MCVLIQADTRYQPELPKNQLPPVECQVNNLRMLTYADVC